MNDTNKQSLLLSVFDKNTSLSSSDVAKLATGNSLVTIKRGLTDLTNNGFLIRNGAGRSVKYILSKKGWMLKPFDVKKYLNYAPDERLSNTNFQFDVLEAPYISLFTDSERIALDKATHTYRTNAFLSTQESYKKELMRFIVEFSWKTSQIEGNTYDLISTERLLLYGEKSPSNTEYEAQMILNQKKALDFILDNLELWNSIKIAYLEDIHGFVAENLGISKNIRKSIVGITGTNYRPLDNDHQLKEVLVLLFAYLNSTKDMYEKALLAVLGVSYIQPFVNGNKRTSRLLSNAILFANNYAPLSYRSVDDRDYKEACLIFYEQNSIEPFKKLFIEQYIFSASNYNIARTDS